MLVDLVNSVKKSKEFYINTALFKINIKNKWLHAKENGIIIKYNVILNFYGVFYCISLMRRINFDGINITADSSWVSIPLKRNKGSSLAFG